MRGVVVVPRAGQEGRQLPVPPELLLPLPDRRSLRHLPRQVAPYYLAPIYSPPTPHLIRALRHLPRQVRVEAGAGSQRSDPLFEAHRWRTYETSPTDTPQALLSSLATYHSSHYASAPFSCPSPAQQRHAEQRFPLRRGRACRPRRPGTRTEQRPTTLPAPPAVAAPCRSPWQRRAVTHK